MVWDGMGWDGMVWYGMYTQYIHRYSAPQKKKKIIGKCDSVAKQPTKEVGHTTFWS